LRQVGARKARRDKVYVLRKRPQLSDIRMNIYARKSRCENKLSGLPPFAKHLSFCLMAKRTFDAELDATYAREQCGYLEGGTRHRKLLKLEIVASRR
jgi:hypothetical protein